MSLGIKLWIHNRFWTLNFLEEGQTDVHTYSLILSYSLNSYNIFYKGHKNIYMPLCLCYTFSGLRVFIALFNGGYVYSVFCP